MVAAGSARGGTVSRRRTNHVHSNRIRVGALAIVAGLVSTGFVGVMQATGASRALGSRAAVQPNVTASVGPFTVDVNNREDVRGFYNQVHEASAGVTDGWSGGSVAPGCAPGSVSTAFLAATLQRLNYFRAMAGESAVTFAGTDPTNPAAGTSSDLNNATAQGSAIMEAANGDLRATPSVGFMLHGPQSVVGGVPVKCWSQQASDTSFNSSLFSTSASSWNSDIVDGWISDGQCDVTDGCDPKSASDPALGHRRNTMD